MRSFALVGVIAVVVTLYIRNKIHSPPTPLEQTTETPSSLDKQHLSPKPELRDKINTSPKKTDSKSQSTHLGSREIIQESDPKTLITLNIPPEVHSSQLFAVSYEIQPAYFRRAHTAQGKLVLISQKEVNTQITLPLNHIGLIYGLRVQPIVISARDQGSIISLKESAPTGVVFDGNSGARNTDISLEVRGIHVLETTSWEEIPWSWSWDYADNNVEIPTISGYCEIEGRAGDHIATWSGYLPAENDLISLRLEPSFSAGGTISNYPENAPQGCKVTVRTRADSPGFILRSADVTPSGLWKMPVIPWLAGKEYYFRIEHHSSAPSQFQIKPIQNSPHVEVPLEWDVGHPLLVLASTKDNTPVGQTTILAQWQTETGWSREHSHTNDDGIAKFQAIPDGQTYLKILSPGYSSQAEGPFITPIPRAEPLRITAYKVGDIHGKVSPASMTKNGFEIVYWQDLGTSSISSFPPNSLGQFTIKDVRPGKTFLMARSSTASSNEAVTINHTANGTDNIELSLERASTVSGLVLDDLSGEGLGGALVQPKWISQLNTQVGDWGIPAMTDSEGRYSNLLVPRGGTILHTSHDGVGSKNTLIAGPIPAISEAPTIRLTPLRRFKISLLGINPDYSKFWFKPTLLRGSRVSNFPTSGVLDFPHCEDSPRVYYQVHTPSNSLYEIEHTSSGDTDWNHSLTIDNGRSITVDYRQIRKEGFSGNIQVRTIYFADNGLEITHTRVPEKSSSELIITDIPAAVCVFRVFHETQIVGTAIEDLRTLADTRIHISPSPNTSPIKLLAHPTENLYQSEAWVEDSKSADYGLSVFIDQDNYIKLGSFPLGPASLYILRQSPPALFQASLNIRDEEHDEQEVPFTLDSSLVVKFQPETSRPLQLRISLAESSYVNLFVPMGGPDLPPPVRLTTGPYRWRISEPGYWPQEGILHTKPGLNQLNLSPRQIGSLQVAGVVGAEVSVYSEADEHLTTDWQALVPSTSASIIPASGVLLLPQLPEGAYRCWVSNSVDAIPVNFEIQPGATTHINLGP